MWATLIALLILQRIQIPSNALFNQKRSIQTSSHQVLIDDLHLGYIHFTDTCTCEQNSHVHVSKIYFSTSDCGNDKKEVLRTKTRNKWTDQLRQLIFDEHSFVSHKSGEKLCQSTAELIS